MKKGEIILKVILLIGLIYSRYWITEPSFLGVPFPLALIVNFLIFFLTINLGLKLILFYYRKRKNLNPKKKDNVTSSLTNLYYLVIAGGIFITFLGFWNIDIRTLFTSLSIVAAAIAIISKDYLTEIISGFVISFSNEISIEDYVNIGDQKGKIIDISLTKIALLNEDDDVVFIPNNKVFSSEIINYTKREIRKVNIDFEMDLRFIKSVEELEHDLIACLDDYKEHIEQDKFNLKINQINKESLTLKFQYQLVKINRDIEREIRKKTARRVINYIHATNISTGPMSTSEEI